MYIVCMCHKKIEFSYLLSFFLNFSKGKINQTIKIQIHICFISLKGTLDLKYITNT